MPGWCVVEFCFPTLKFKFQTDVHKLKNNDEAGLDRRLGSFKQLYCN